MKYRYTISALMFFGNVFVTDIARASDLLKTALQSYEEIASRMVADSHNKAIRFRLPHRQQNLLATMNRMKDICLGMPIHEFYKYIKGHKSPITGHAFFEIFDFALNNCTEVSEKELCLFLLNNLSFKTGSDSKEFTVEEKKVFFHKILLIGIPEAIDVLIKSGWECDNLRLAVALGGLDRIKQLIPASRSEEELDESSNALLHVAAANGQVEAIKILLALGRPVDAQNIRSETPLHAAIEHNSLECVKVLIDHGASLTARDYLGKAALHVCTKKPGLASILRYVLSRGANPNIKDLDGETPLHAAVSQRCIGLLKILKDAQADINATSLTGMTPLHIACDNGLPKTAEQLIECGARLDDTNVAGDTPLHTAIRKLSVGCVKLLIKKKASLHTEDGTGNSPLHIVSALRVGVLGLDKIEEILTLLLDAGVHVDTRNKQGRTALFETLFQGSFTTDGGLRQALILLQKGAKTTIRDADGNTPLLIASKNYVTSSPAVTCALIEAGADLHDVDENQRTALYYWCLLEASPELMIFSTKSIEGLITTMVKLGAAVSIQDKDGRTPLHFSMLQGLPHDYDFKLITEGYRLPSLTQINQARARISEMLYIFRLMYAQKKKAEPNSEKYNGFLASETILETLFLANDELRKDVCIILLDELFLGKRNVGKVPLLAAARPHLIRYLIDELENEFLRIRTDVSVPFFVKSQVEEGKISEIYAESIKKRINERYNSLLLIK